MTTTEIVLILFAIDILVHLAVSVAVGVYLHNRAKGASVQIGNAIMGMVPQISGALAEQVADKVVEKLSVPSETSAFWDRESIVG